MADRILSRREASDYLGLDLKTFDNYFIQAGEFGCLPREGGGRYYFRQSHLEEWRLGREWRTVTLDRDDYALCLDFALAMHFRGYVQSDWGTARQREFGQKITNWVKGQLAEMGVQRFLRDRYDIEVELDFNLHQQIVPQDIVAVVRNGRRETPRIGIGIKATKPKSAFLVLGENEVDIEERRSDYYILCRPDIADDHLLRLTRDAVVEAVQNQPHFDTYRRLIPDFEPIPCEVAGYCPVDELDYVGEIPGQRFDGMRYVKASGCLYRSNEHWRELVNLL